MKNLKKTRFFSLGRKWVFTLALFLLVFAAASVVKIQAAGNVTGWLWGGSEDANLVPPSLGSVDGNDTMVYWVSTNKINCDSDNNGLTDTVNYPDCPVGQPSNYDYGVTIPNDGNLSGYAWSPNLGYLSFNEIELAGCPNGACKAWRTGNKIHGWARFMEFKINSAQAGGWGGWVKLRYTITGVGERGVEVSGSNLTGYGWNGEESGTGGNMANGLGYINFSQAKIVEVCSLAFVPSTTKTVNESSTNNEVIIQEAGSSCNCGSVSLSSSNASIASVSPASIDFSSPIVQSSNITLQMGSVSSTTSYPNIITASSTNCGTAKLGLLIQNIPVCTLTCPSEIIVATGQTKSVKSEIGITGEAGCAASAVNCSESGTDANGNIDVTSGCDVSETGDLRYGSSELRANGGTGSCTAPINIKGPGWVETNP